MTKLIYHAEDGREVHISKGYFVYLKTKEGEERNWEWQYIPAIHKAIDRIFKEAEVIYDQVTDLLPKDIPMGKIK